MGCTQALLTAEIEEKYQHEVQSLCSEVLTQQSKIDELNESIKCEHTRRVNAEKMRSIAEERIKKLVKREKDLELNFEEFEAERHLHSHATDTIIDNIHSVKSDLEQKLVQLEADNKALRNKIASMHSETAKGVVLEGNLQKIRLSHVLRNLKRSERHVIFAESDKCCFVYWSDDATAMTSNKGIVRAVYKQEESSSYISDEEISRMFAIETVDDKIVHFLADSNEMRDMWFDQILETLASKGPANFESKRTPGRRSSVME